MQLANGFFLPFFFFGLIEWSPSGNYRKDLFFWFIGMIFFKKKLIHKTPTDFLMIYRLV